MKPLGSKLLNFAKGSFEKFGPGAAAEGATVGGGSALSRFWNASPANRALATVGAVDAGIFGLGLGADVLGASPTLQRVGLADGSSDARSLEAIKRANYLSLEQEYEQRRINQLAQQNAINLAQYAPDLYGQVMAGRMLPRDTVAIGGTPRVDLLAQLSTLMAQGAARPPTPLDADPLMMQLTESLVG